MVLFIKDWIKMKFTLKSKLEILKISMNSKHNHQPKNQHNDMSHIT